MKRIMNTAGKVAFKDFKRHLPLTILALPTIIVIFIMNYIPLYGLAMPFVDYNIRKGLLKSTFVGFDNFKYLISSELPTILRNTILYNLAFIMIGTILSLAFALMLFELGSRGVKFFQTSLLFPFFMSWVIISFLFLGFLDADHGFINKIIMFFGKEPVNWYSTIGAWPFILVIAAVWKGLGYGTIIYYASLMAIDKELFESAKLEGARWHQMAYYISIPMIKPLIVILNIMAIGKILNSDFGLFYQLPLNLPTLYSVTDVFDTYVYRMLRSLGDFGMSSAAGFVQAVFGFLLVLVTNYVVKKTTNESLF